MLNKNKTDHKLGEKVACHLESLGIQTPFNRDMLHEFDSVKIEKLTENFRDVWTTLGMDLDDDSLAGTPLRMAKMYVSELYWGLHAENFPKCAVFDNKMKYNEMVLERDITVMSNCEHHGVTIDGLAHIAYIPKDKVLGLSKLNRIVEYFAKRPQIQERLVEQIHAAISLIVETDDVAVSIKARHYCVISRGVEDSNSSTVTNRLSGAFNDPDTRKEFLMSIQ